MWDIGIQCSDLVVLKLVLKYLYFLEIIEMYFLLSLR